MLDANGAGWRLEVHLLRAFIGSMRRCLFGSEDLSDIASGNQLILAVLLLDFNDR